MPEFQVTTPDNNLVTVTAPEGASREQVLQFAAQNYDPQRHGLKNNPKEAPEGFFDSVSSGFSKGIEDVKNLVGTAGKAQILGLLGDEEGKEQALGEFRDAAEINALQHPQQTESLFDIEDFQDFSTYAGSTLGQGLSSTAPSIVGGALTGLVTRSPKAAIGVAGLASGSQNIPETFVNLAEDGTIEDPELKALPFGALKTALDTFTPARIFGKQFGDVGKQIMAKKLLSKAGMASASKQVGKEIAETAAIEGITESAQESIDIAAEQVLSEMPDELFTKETMGRLMEAGFAGALTGGTLGGASGAIQTARAPRVGTEGLTLEEEVIETPDKKASDPRPQRAQTIENSLPPQLKRNLKSSVSRNVLMGESGIASDLNPSEKIQFSQQTNPSPLKGVKKRVEQSLSEAFPKQQKVTNFKSLEQTLSKNKAFKEGELAFTGLKELIEDSPQGLSKADTVRYLETALPQVQEMRTNPVRESTVYADKTLEPQKVLEENYREFTINLPDNNPIKDFGLDPHFRRNNTIGFFRTTDKQDDSLFVEELQSDVHQPDVDTEDANIPEGVPFKSNWEDLAIRNLVKIGAQEDKQRVVFPSSKGVKNTIGKSQKALRSFYDKRLPKKIEKIGRELGVPVSQGTYSYVNPRTGQQETIPVLSMELDQETRNTINNNGVPFTKTLKEMGSLKKPRTSPKASGPEQTFSILTNKLGQKAQMSPVEDNGYNGSLKKLKKSLRSIAGPQIDTAFLDTLNFDSNVSSEQQIVGAQWASLIDLGLNLPTLKTTSPSSMESGLHEAWNFLEENKFFTKEEQQILENKTEALANILREEQGDGLSHADMRAFLNTPEGRKEIRANAFGFFGKDWLSQNNKMKKVQRRLPNDLDVVLKKGLTSVEKVGETVRKDLGWRSSSDMFSSPQEASQAVNEVVNENRIVDLQQTLGKGKRLTDLYETTYGGLESSLRGQTEAFEKNNFFSPIGNFTRYLSSGRHVGSKNPAMAVAFTLRENIENLQNSLFSRYRNNTKEFDKLPKEARTQLSELGEFLRRTDQKSRLDEEGHLVFKRDGKTVRLKDKTLSSAYAKNQQAFSDVLTDMEKSFKNTIFLSFQDQLSGPDFTREQLEGLKTEENVEQIDGYLEQLDAFDRMRKTDFVPFMRFGQWGIAVVDTQDIGEDGKPKLVGMYKVETGSFKKKYNKQQLQEAKERIQEQFGNDPQRYRIHGDGGKQLSLDAPLESFTPFHANQREKLAKVGVSEVESLDALMDALNSEGMDLETYSNLREKVLGKALLAKQTRGFKQRFVQSEMIEGNSKDWDRVQSAYFHGAAHFLSRMNYEPQSARIRNDIPLIQDPKTRDLIEKYLDYTESPAEDMQAMRTFNFMWALGFNPSTAVLQFMTLPTTTLGAQSRFNPNPLTNLGRMSKWLGIGRILAKHGSEMNKGSLIFDFGNDKGWAEVQKKYNMTDEQVAFYRQALKTQDDRNTIGGLLVEESVGTTAFESRGRFGEMREKFANVGNTAGLLISGAEQFSRLATFGSSLEMVHEDQGVRNKALQMLENDPLFQEKLRTDNQLSVDEALASFIMDDAHAVFGRRGRPSFMKGIGGALVVPFMTYVHQMLELMWRMGTQQGTQGKIGLGVTLGAFFTFSGLLGLPGGELLKELYEEIHRELAEEEIDLTNVIRQWAYNFTGSEEVAKTVTNGAFRGFGGLAVSPRIGMPIVGQDLIMSALGIRGSSSDFLGVSGSVLDGAFKAIHEYNTHDGISLGVMENVLPIAAANVVKAGKYSQRGVETQRGQTLVPQEDVTPGMVALRAFGIQSGEVAQQRELAFWKDVLNRKDQPAYSKFRERAKRAYENYLLESQKGNPEKANEEYKKYQGVLDNLMEWGREENYPVPLGAFVRSVQDAGTQSLAPNLNLLKGINDAYAEDFKETIKATTGKTPDEFTGVK